MLEILLLVSLALSQTPPPFSPMWANVFWQNFTETTEYPGIGVHVTQGSYYYNYYTPASRVDRDSGRYNAFCGLSGPYSAIDTPCSELVVGGNRYVYYSQLNQCCFCCNAEQGCDVLLPWWLDNAVFIDKEFHNGYSTYKWETLSGSGGPLFYYETADTFAVNRAIISIYEEPNKFMDFSGTKFNYVPDNIFNLPSICNTTYTCDYGACQQIRQVASFN